MEEKVDSLLVEKAKDGMRGMRIMYGLYDSPSHMNFDEFRNIQDEIIALAKLKNADYGHDNLISFGEKSPQALVVFMNDCMRKLKNIEWEGRVMNFDKCEDIAKDMINYCTYYIMLKRGKLLTTQPTSGEVLNALR